MNGIVHALDDNFILIIVLEDGTVLDIFEDSIAVTEAKDMNEVKAKVKRLLDKGTKYGRKRIQLQRCSCFLMSLRMLHAGATYTWSRGDVENLGVRAVNTMYNCTARTFRGRHRRGGVV